MRGGSGLACCGAGEMETSLNARGFLAGALLAQAWALTGASVRPDPRPAVGAEPGCCTWARGGCGCAGRCGLADPYLGRPCAVRGVLDRRVALLAM